MRNSVIVSPKRSMSSVLSRSAPLLALTLAATLLFSVNAAGITSSGMQHLTRDVFVSCRSRVARAAGGRLPRGRPLGDRLVTGVENAVSAGPVLSALNSDIVGKRADISQASLALGRGVRPGDSNNDPSELLVSEVKHAGKEIA